MQGCYPNERIRCSKACGKTHGHAIHGQRSTEYHIWSGLKDRCLNTNSKYYSYYGGRGITVCERWRKSFEAFLEDMGKRPSPKHSIDRWPDQNGNYEPGNCRWATKRQQQNNMRSNHRITVNGIETTIAEYARLIGVTPTGVYNRIQTGKSLTEPFAKRRRRK